jgi:hypothetical protein
MISSPIDYWSMAGLEVSLQVLLVTICILKFFPTNNYSSFKLNLVPLYLSLAFVVRPDSIVIYATCIFLCVLNTLFLNTHYSLIPDILSIKNLKNCLIKSKEFYLYFCASIIIISCVFLFQHFYYGDWLPNTYYLKATNGASSLNRGLIYLGKFLFSESFHLHYILGITLFISLPLATSKKNGFQFILLL